MIKTILCIGGGVIWGGFLGFMHFQWIFSASKKSVGKGLRPISNPLRMILTAGGLFIPAFINLIALLSTFGGFAIGFAVWWLWFRGKLTSGGSNG